MCGCGVLVLVFASVRLKKWLHSRFNGTMTYIESMRHSVMGMQLFYALTQSYFQTAQKHKIRHKNEKHKIKKKLTKIYHLIPMARLRHHAPDTLDRYDRAGTIGDYLAAWLLNGRDAHYIDIINAAGVQSEGRCAG